MFSPDVAATNPHHLRPKRSRRQGSEDSIKLPQAKKRRSALRKDTFQPPEDAAAKEAPASDEPVVQANGHAPEENPSNNGASVRSAELTLRGGRKAEKRAERGDGPFVLSSNDYYSVAQLPALPEQIRSHSSTAFSSTISPENGYALATTHSHALIWPYNSSSAVPPTKETSSFALPYSIPPNEPLPIATFTAKSATKEPGLVVVTPVKGKIVYWESIFTASSLVTNPQANGIQGSVPGMFTGETITSVVNAEPAGFILTFSHGRVAHLTLKDQLGRPAIGVQFLRKIPSGSQGSLFGSIRNVFGGSGRKNVAAARAGRASRGQRDVIIVTGDAEIEVWDTRLSVGNSLKYQHNVKEEILDSLKNTLPSDGALSYQFSILDFAFSTKSNTSMEVAKTNGDSPEDVLFLAGLSHSDHTNYYIIELQISQDLVSIKSVHPISCYQRITTADATWQPRLVVPRPGQTAFVVFDSATVLYSLARPEESPSSQLLLEGGSAAEPFQDCIRFQEDTPFRIIGCGAEDQQEDRKHPSIVIAVQSFGLVRISATSDQSPTEDLEEVKVTPKSKIEQAVFFGNLKNNPLDLLSTADRHFDTTDVEAAALEISNEILTSKSRYLPKASPSIEQNLRSRAKAHDDLAFHLSKHYAPLSRSARFQLLWNAEKLAAQRAMWKHEEEHRKQKGAGEETILKHILFYLHHDEKTKPDSSKGENDSVRHWFTFDADKIQFIIPWIQHVHAELYKDEVRDPKPVSENMLQTADLFLAMYETAFQYRENNASVYGLGDEIFTQGLLTGSYTELPMPWTSEYYDHAAKHVEISSEFARSWWVPNNGPKTAMEKPNPNTVRKIGASLPRQTEIMSRVMNERARWDRIQDTDECRNEEAWLKIAHKNNTREQLAIMAGLGFSSEAISICEKLQDMQLLVDLNLDVIVQISKQCSEQGNARDIDRLQREAEKVNERMDGYFETFKDRWAQAYYEKLVQDGQLGSLLNDDKNQVYLTKFLRRNPAYAKISWINDVLGEKSYTQASQSLVAVADKQESDLWSKKVELCLSKLAALAAVESKAKANKTKPKPDEKQEAHILGTTSSISLIDLQTRLYLHVTSLIGRNILDATSRHELAFEILGKTSSAVKDRPAFKGLLYDGLGILLRQESMPVERLLDILTLMNPIGSDPEHQDKITDETMDAGVVGSEFFFALNAVDFALPQVITSEDNAALEKRSKRDALMKMVWRRIFLRDNWQDLNNTSERSDDDNKEVMRNTVLWSTAMQIFEDDLLQSSSPSASSTLSSPARTSSVSTPVPSPTEILNESDFLPPVLQSRFKPQELDLVRRDLDLEYQQLQNMVENGRLDKWFDGILKDARDEAVQLNEKGVEEEGDAVREEEEGAESRNDRGDEDVEMKEDGLSLGTDLGGTMGGKGRRSVRFAAAE